MGESAETCEQVSFGAVEREKGSLGESEHNCINTYEFFTYLGLRHIFTGLAKGDIFRIFCSMTVSRGAEILNIIIQFLC